MHVLLDTLVMDIRAIMMTLTNVLTVAILVILTPFVPTLKLDTTANVDLDGKVMVCHARSHMLHQLHLHIKHHLAVMHMVYLHQLTQHQHMLHQQLQHTLHPLHQLQVHLHMHPVMLNKMPTEDTSLMTHTLVT